MLLNGNTAIRGGYVGNNPVNWVDPWGLSASEKQGNNGNANLLLSGLTKTLSGSVKTVTGLAGAAAGMLASAVLVADNGTVVLTVDDAALLVTVPFTAASRKYALNGAKAALEWWRYKGTKHDDSGAEISWKGDRTAYRNYNGNDNLKDGREHREWYADTVMDLVQQTEAKAKEKKKNK